MAPVVPFIPYIIGAAGVAATAVSVSQQAEAAEEAAEFNARIGRRNADIQAEQTRSDVERARREGLVRSGAVRAAAGAAGGLEGSALDIAGSSAAQQELDILNIGKQGKLREEALLQGAQLDILRAQGERRAGQAGTAATLLSGAGTLATRFSNRPQ
jgi:hypothetical protein